MPLIGDVAGADLSGVGEYLAKLFLAIVLVWVFALRVLLVGLFGPDSLAVAEGCVCTLFLGNLMGFCRLSWKRWRSRRSEPHFAFLGICRNRNTRIDIRRARSHPNKDSAA